MTDTAPGINLKRLVEHIARIKPRSLILLCFKDEIGEVVLEGPIFESDVLSAMDVLDVIHDRVVQSEITPSVNYTGNA